MLTVKDVVAEVGELTVNVSPLIFDHAKVGPEPAPPLAVIVTLFVVTFAEVGHELETPAGDSVQTKEPDASPDFDADSGGVADAPSKSRNLIGSAVGTPAFAAVFGT